MYKKHSLWDEDKWDIHSESSSGYAGQGSKSSQDYHDKESQQDYHKNESYNTGKADEDKIKDAYRSNEEKEDKKDDDEKEETIVDAIEQEEKYQKKEEEDEFQAVASQIIPNTPENLNIGDEKTDKKASKKKKNKSIEEAIKAAVKEEKEIVHAD